MDKRISHHRGHHPVRRAFSRSAEKYDELAQVQSHIGVQLLARIAQSRNHFRILDVGMGTGLMAQQITKFFPKAQVVGIDFAEGMIHCAQKRSRVYSVIQADARHLPFRNAAFDLIVSNLAYQWIDPLAKAFGENQRCLMPGGAFTATLFGRHSLREMFEAFHAAGAKDYFLARLPDLAQVEQAVAQSGLRVQDVRSQMMTCDFHGLWELLVWLKGIGANTLARKGFIGKKVLMKANEYYFQNFKTRPGVAVTFEVIWVEAKK